MMHQTICDDSCNGIHGSGQRFYVSVRGDRVWGLLLGPYVTHEEALGEVDRGRQLAEDIDPRACWYEFGTTAMDTTKKTILGR